MVEKNATKSDVAKLEAEYKKVFGKDPSCYIEVPNDSLSNDEYCEILKECIKRKIVIVKLIYEGIDFNEWEIG